MHAHPSDAISDRRTRDRPLTAAILHAFSMYLSVTDTTGLCPLTSGAVCLTVAEWLREERHFRWRT